MFTQNYIDYTGRVFLGETGYVSITTPSGTGTSIDISSNNQIGYIMRRAQCLNFQTASTFTCGVYFGSGSTPAKVNDITLEAPIVSGLSITNADKTLLSYDGNGVRTASASYTVKNTTGEEIVIREIGCFATGNGHGNNASAVMALFERTVLAEPITLAPGVTKLITYKITFNHR